MKDKYLNKQKFGWTGRLWALLAVLWLLPFVMKAQSLTVSPTTTPTSPDNYGSVAVGTVSSPAKQYTITGTDLSGNITVSFANASSFEGSTDNVTFGNSISLSATGGTLYVRFRPTAVGTTTVNASNGRITVTGSDDSFTTYSKNIFVQGTGTPGTPAITVNPTALGFNDQEVGTTSNPPMTFTVNATSLGTTPITVTAPNGFQISYNGSTYGKTASISPNAGGSVTNQVVSVVFKPTAAKAYAENITLTSSTASASVSVAGTGTNPKPILTAAPSPLPDFGSVVVGTSSSVSYSFTVSGQNLQSAVTIKVPAGFAMRIGSNFFSSNDIVLSPANGTLASTSIDVRFSPTAAVAYASDITVTSLNATSQFVRVTGQGTPGSGDATLRVNPGTIAFGTITSSGSTSTRSFEVSGTDLTAPILLTPSSSNIEIRNATVNANGPFEKNITITPVNGIVPGQNIEVRLVKTVAKGTFTELISITSTSADDMQVSITASNPSGNTSDISVVNSDNNTFTFVTRPNTTSVSQRFSVSGNNLVQDLTVEPVGPSAKYFEVSDDNITFRRKLTFPVEANNAVPSKAVYVRFTPGAEEVNITGTIRNSSTPAPDFDVSLTGISAPTIRLNKAIEDFRLNGNVVKGTKTDPKSVQLDGFLLSGPVQLRFPNDDADKDRNPSQIPQYEFSLDGGNTYKKSETISPNGEGNFTKTVLVRYAPVRVGSASQVLQFQNQSFGTGTDYFELTSGFGQASGFAIAAEPTAQSSAKVARSSDGTSATITFNLATPPAGKSYGSSRLVFGSSTYSTLPPRLFPADKANFNPGSTYGTGTPLDPDPSSGTPPKVSTTDTYVVFSGAATSFTVTNLDPALNYNFFGFEYNNDGLLNAENYLVPNNQPLIALPVELTAFTATLRNAKVNLIWSTASEKNSKGFEVQRSQNGKDFALLQFVAGQGSTSSTTNYAAVDAQPLGGTSYYRLKQVDHDGTFAYSPVAVITNGAAPASEVSLYPNPAQDVVTVSLGQLPAAGARVTVADMMGRVVLSDKLVER